MDAMLRRQAIQVVGPSGPVAQQTEFEYEGVSRLKTVNVGNLSATYTREANREAVGQIVYKREADVVLRTRQGFDGLGRLKAVSSTTADGTVVALALLLLGSPARAEATVDWKTDGYRVALWKLYQSFLPLRAHRWAETEATRTAERLKEIDVYESQYLSTHICRLEGASLDAVPQSHELRVSLVIDRRTNLIVDAQPTIRFDLGKAMSLREIQKHFHDDPLLGRLLRLESLRAEVADGLGIDSIEITFRDLRNRNLEWGCNGFIIDTNLIPKPGDSRVVTYFVGSGLDPFVNRDGRKRKQVFESKDILVDPEYGPECELDESGARVFLKQ